jgi:hypothetical protein
MLFDFGRLAVQKVLMKDIINAKALSRFFNTNLNALRITNCLKICKTWYRKIKLRLWRLTN